MAEVAARGFLDMRRLAVGMIVAGAVAVLPATGCVAAAAMSRSDSGTLAGQAVFAERGARGVVAIFNSAGRSVGRRDVRYPRGHFRFVLKPGRYKVKLELPKRWNSYCPHETTARVHANRATYVDLSQMCENTY